MKESLPDDFEPGFSFKNLLLFVTGKVTLDQIFEKEIDQPSTAKISKDNVKKEAVKLVKKQVTQPKTKTATKQKKKTVDWRRFNQKDLIMFSDLDKERKRKIATVTQIRDDELYKNVLKVINLWQRIDRVNLKKQAPKLAEIWTYHDETCQQMIAHVPKNGRHADFVRDKEKRATLEPTFKTTKNTRKDEAVYDRTHMIPFGYIGTENDYRLVVPFSAKLNRGEIAAFENKISNMNQSCYWCTFIEKKDWGARWISKVFDEDGNLLDSLQVDWGNPKKPVILRWGLR